MINTKIHNRFDIFRKDPVTWDEKQIAFAENIILDRYFLPPSSTLVSGTYYGNSNYSIHVGTGTGTLAEDRTTMFSELFRLNATGATYSYDAVNRVWSVRQSITITETQYNGNTLTEIGAGGHAYMPPHYYWLTTHAMLRDMNGNPVSIAKTESDILTFYSTVYVLVPESFDSGAIYPFPTFRSNLVNRLLGISDFQGSHGVGYKRCISVISNKDQLNDLYAASVNAPVSFDTARKIWTFVCPRLAAASGNFPGGIYGMQDSDGICFDFINSSEFPGSPITEEPLGTGDGTLQDFKTKFGHVVSGAVVKVDGVVDATATVDVNKPYDNNLIRLMKVLSYNDAEFLPGVVDGANKSTAIFVILENPHYATWGIDTYTGKSTKLYCSDDMVTWTFVRDGSGAVSATYRSKRYWKVTGAGYNYPAIKEFLSADLSTAYLKNVHFSSPPAVGAALTISYTTRVLAKDANHVYDTTYRVTIDRYTP